MSHATPLIEFI